MGRTITLNIPNIKPLYILVAVVIGVMDAVYIFSKNNTVNNSRSTLAAVMSKSIDN